MQNPSGMSKEIKAIEISRESLSVGSTFTESIALQSSLSAPFIHWGRSLTGFMLAAWSAVCPTPRGKEQGQWASGLLQTAEETGAVICTGAFSQSKPESNPSTCCRNMWWSEAPRWKGAAGAAAVLPPHSLHCTGRHHARFPMIFKSLMQCRAITSGFALWISILLGIVSKVNLFCWRKTTKPKPQSRSRFLSPKKSYKVIFCRLGYRGNNRNCNISVEKLILASNRHANLVANQHGRSVPGKN